MTQDKSPLFRVGTISPNEEFVQDIILILHVFSCRV